MTQLQRDDLAWVCAVHELGSLAAAAAHFGVSPSVATKRLAQVEAHLGARLFARTTRRISPTAAGLQLIDGAKVLLAQFDALEDQLHDGAELARGPLKIASSFGFGRRVLGPLISDFCARYPNVNVHLQLTETLPDLNVNGFDGAVWLWQASDRPGQDRRSEMTAKKLASNARVLVAAPTYVQSHSPIRQVADLANHTCLIVREHVPAYDVWQLQATLRGKPQHERIQIRGPLSTNSGELALDWCLQGQGVMLRSWWDAAAHVAAGSLVRVLPQWSMLDADVHWLAPFRPVQPKRVRLFNAHLTEYFKTWNPAHVELLKAESPRPRRQR
jgi:LysR family transcriptional regulator, transcriptional activator for dmlA